MTIIKTTSRYGWKRDSLDHRDHRLSMKLGPLKDSDLRPLMPHVYDQGSTSSCLANAIAGAIEYSRARQKLTSFTPSRLFIYYNARELENTIAQPDAGGEIRDGIKSVATLGAPSESEWLFSEDPLYVTAKPFNSAYLAAKRSLVDKYALVDQTLSSILNTLSSGFPVIFGSSVFNAFESNAVATTGMVPMPSSTDAPVGGHAELIVGAKHAEKLFIVRNSWGPDWGDKGYGYFPFDYLLDPDLASDFWVINHTE